MLTANKVIRQVKTGDSLSVFTLFARDWLTEGEWGEYGKVGLCVLQVGHAQLVGTIPAPKPVHLQ